MFLREAIETSANLKTAIELLNRTRRDVANGSTVPEDKELASWIMDATNILHTCLGNTNMQIQDEINEH